jgi:hypothetical protein
MHPSRIGAHDRRRRRCTCARCRSSPTTCPASWPWARSTRCAPPPDRARGTVGTRHAPFHRPCSRGYTDTRGYPLATRPSTVPVLVLGPARQRGACAGAYRTPLGRATRPDRNVALPCAACARSRSSLQAQGLLGDAVAAWRRAHELAPGDAAVREGLAVVLTDQGTKLKNAGARCAASRPRSSPLLPPHPAWRSPQTCSTYPCPLPRS